MSREPLPPTLAKQDEITSTDHFITTTEYHHDPKHHSQLYGNGIKKKAPGHWKVNDVRDLAEKMRPDAWRRRPLTMGEQESEMTAEYKVMPGIRDKYKFDFYVPREYRMQAHPEDGPLKYGEGSTQNPTLPGADKHIITDSEPYLSTTHKEFRSYPKKDNPTFWDCDEYPKAWGHGSKNNLLPKHAVRRERLPMRDTLVFKKATRLPRIPKAMAVVSQGGLKSEYTELFPKQDHVRGKENYYCAVDTPFTLPQPGTKSIFTAPQMYHTESQNIGSEKKNTV